VQNSPGNRLAEYGTLDAKVIVPVKLWGLASGVFIRGYNLLDRRNEGHQGYPDKGIRGIAGVNVSW
jgi:hypothetical protein